MNNAHFHLVVNHLPIVGLLIGTLTLITGLLIKRREVKLTSLGILTFAALTSIAAFLTGEGAEEMVENMPGISETLIHTHEEYAESFLSLTLVTGGLALLTFFVELKKARLSKYLFAIVLLASISDLVLAKYLGTSGGEIRHTEIRGDSRVIDYNHHQDD